MGAAYLWMLAWMGLAGSLHCAGMCGPLALLAAGGRRAWVEFPLYLAGKASTYIFLGALAGALGEHLLQAAPLGVGARALALGGGLALVVVALESLGLLRVPVPDLKWLEAASGALRRLGTEHGAAGKLLFGAANGLLPCPMTYGFLAMGAATGSAVAGAAAGFVLGLTSAVPLAACALAGRPLMRGRVRHFAWFSGAVMAAAGAMLIWRALGPGVAGAHHH
jgi:sulfite exporter TauE/SafE